jgi:RimJ/RimL family protein N-acetyltransferase
VPADAPEVQRLAGDARIADTTATIPHPYPKGAAEAWIATHVDGFLNRTRITFALTLLNGPLIGAVSLLEVSTKHARAELGLWVGVEQWGNGYCTEAVSRLIQYAFQELAITRIQARCFARNAASARVMVKAGLVKEGNIVKQTLKNGVYEDMLIFGLCAATR